MDGVNVFGTTTVYFVNQKRACVGALVRRAVNASHVSITYHHHFPDFAIPFSTSNDTLALDKSVCPRHHSVTRDGSTRCARRRVRPWQSRPRPRGFRCASRTRGGLSVPRDAVMTAWFVARFRLRRGVPVGAAFHRCRGARAAGARILATTTNKTLRLISRRNGEMGLHQNPRFARCSETPRAVLAMETRKTSWFRNLFLLPKTRPAQTKTATTPPSPRRTRSAPFPSSTKAWMTAARAFLCRRWMTERRTAGGTKRRRRAAARRSRRGLRGSPRTPPPRRGRGLTIPRTHFTKSIQTRVQGTQLTRCTPRPPSWSPRSWRCARARRAEKPGARRSMRRLQTRRPERGGASRYVLRVSQIQAHCLTIQG